MKSILVIDDELEMLDSFRKILSHNDDYNLTLIDKPLIARELVSNQKFDLVITDLKLPEISGMDILQAALKSFPDQKVIMISGYGTIEASVQAMKYGAFDFIEKPFTSKKLFESVERALNFNNKDVKQKEEEQPAIHLPGIISKSKEMEDVANLVTKVAPGKMNVLITGESGTGKELIARAVHSLSKSSSDPFVPVNCGALPEHLFESEIFGHERGAFTGAIKTKPGLLEFANHGTFFLDEIGELSQALQVKLLRMLEERKIRRVGGQNEISIDVRIIAATNKDLPREVELKNFREDLYYRLSTLQIEIPPLRERTDDILPLANHFVKELCRKEDRSEKFFTEEAKEALISYSWPGNVRELQNIIGRTFFLCSGKTIDVEDLPIPVSGKGQKLDKKFLNPPYKTAKDLLLEKFEIDYLTHHLKKNKGNITKTAESCGIDRRTIHRLINKYQIVYKDGENIQVGDE